MPFLPTSKKEVEQLGWDQLDVILFSGDAYVDHPSFGAAVVGRVIESCGLKVAIVPQPNWQDDLRDFRKLGRPRYFFAVSPGAMDSMVNHYTAARRRRSDDAYTPGGRSGARPDYPSVVYTKILKMLFPDVPVLLGGIEASLRRVTHYDYWQDRLRPSILVDSGADILVYGMGEKPLTEICTLLRKGVPFSSLKTVPQTSFLIPADSPLPKNKNWETIELYSHEQCLDDKMCYAKNFKHVEEESNRKHAARLTQQCGNSIIVLNPQYPPMTQQEIDASFDLPYMYQPHPRYNGKGDIPAFEMIKNSVNLHRGCFGGCSFCTISAHQGKFIASRSVNSIMREVQNLVKQPWFKGYISDLGGPSANMYGLHGRDESICEVCRRPSCIFPEVCKNMNTDLSPLIELYHKVDALPEVKKSFIGSGVRYDILLAEGRTPDETRSHHDYTRELITKHVSGRLKVAPEHTSKAVLDIMRKPDFCLFHKFKQEFDKINKEEHLNQQLIPYFISSHPGCHDVDMAELAAETHDMDFRLEQVQDFTPTPMTVSTVIYYSGIHPYTLKPVYTARTPDEKQRQRLFFFWYKPEYKPQIMKALKDLHRFDIIERLFDKSASIPREARFSGPSSDSSRDSRKPHGSSNGQSSRLSSPSVKSPDRHHPAKPKSGKNKTSFNPNFYKKK
ncbi:MAG: YgiQ family radical SAM protein [Bacteroidales bacterium]|nr:YgiQ family radical SAM protein [Bacteroidales bacterium]